MEKKASSTSSCVGAAVVAAAVEAAVDAVREGDGRLGLGGLKPILRSDAAVEGNEVVDLGGGWC
jgi:hypothetical protein